MPKTFYFYDLETSGLNPREDRIMQFAGQRTNDKFEPIGEPHNVLVRLNDDTLPSPEAVMVTGITPQSTQIDSYSEAEFCTFLSEEVFIDNTISLGYNTLRFDDEFIRHLLWRNFHDPYEWSYKNGCSRWDMLDVVRMTRALRPEGIEWPTDDKGNPTNRLELLTKVNGIEHANAHDALSDVTALIEITKMIQSKQPQLFTYLLKLRDKKEVQALVNLDEKHPFVYVSGRYDATYQKATVAFPLTSAPFQNVVVFDLRHDPSPFFDLSEDEILRNLYAPWEERSKPDFTAIPLKILKYNQCPAVAPLGVLSQNDGWNKIGIDQSALRANMQSLQAHPEFAEKVRSVFEKKRDFAVSKDPEAMLYDAFINDPKDKLRVEAVRNANADDLADFHPEFKDERLPGLLLHYKARNYPSTLSEQEQSIWEAWRSERLNKQLPSYAKSISKIAKDATEAQVYLLSELQLWAENILPVSEE